MRTRIGFALNRMLVNVQTRGTPVKLTWVTYSGGTVDPGTGATINATATPQSLGPINALVHVEEAKSVLRQFVEIEVGDLIVDFPPAVQIDGLDNLRFVIDGQNYEQKEIGGRLAKAWDTIIAGNRSLRTVLLKKAT